jgi:photosystem II reaction center protein PsbP
MYWRYENSASILAASVAICILMSSMNWALDQYPYPHLAEAVLSTSNSAGDQQAQSASATNFTVYKNSVLGVRVEYPSNWTVVENLTYGKVNFNGPLPNFLARGGPAAHMSVFLPPYLNPSVDNIVNSYITRISKTSLNFKLIESNATTIAGNTAHKVVYTWVSSLLGPTESVIVYTINHGIAYSLGFGVSVDQYSTLLPIIQKMIQSFEITNPPMKPR